MKHVSSLFLCASARLVFIVALVIRWGVCLVSFRAVPPTADGAFYHVVAQRIAQGEGYTWLWPDGVVTHAAHYPVGYPALMGGLYLLFGAAPLWAMLLNGFLGAAAAWAAHGVTRSLVEDLDLGPWGRAAPSLAAWGIALSPSLVAYTPALMTEGVVGAVLLLASRSAMASGPGMGKKGRAWILAGILVGLATYLRPQSILFAPFLGFLACGAGFRRRALGAVVVTGVALCAVAPWTYRNCATMDRCMLVSANGGWNLLIGTYEEGKGAWVPLTGERVPSECREVFAEAEKDRCFGQAGMQRVVRRPLAWAALMGPKLDATFDHTAAAAAHLVEAGALDSETSRPLQGAEVGSHRLTGLLCLVALWGVFRISREPKLRKVPVLALLFAGALGFLGVSAALGWAVCALSILLVPCARQARAGALLVFSTAVTAGIHALFFGAGRYFLPHLILVTPWAGLGAAYIIARIRRFPASCGEDFDRPGQGEG